MRTAQKFYAAKAEIRELREQLAHQSRVVQMQKEASEAVWEVFGGIDHNKDECPKNNDCLQCRTANKYEAARKAVLDLERALEAGDIPEELPICGDKITYGEGTSFVCSLPPEHGNIHRSGKEWWKPGRGDADKLRAEVRRLTAERDEFKDKFGYAFVRAQGAEETRDTLIAEHGFDRQRAEKAEAALSALRQRCEQIAREVASKFISANGNSQRERYVALEIADAINALRPEKEFAFRPQEKEEKK